MADAVRRTQTPPSPTRTAGSYEDRLLAEAARAYEELTGAAGSDAEAIAAAQQAGGGFQERLITYARNHAEAERLRAALSHVRSLLTLAILAGVVLALLAGMAAGRAALGLRAGEPVNFFWALGGLLGAQTFLLVLWMVMLVVLPRGLASGSLGAFLLAAGRTIAARLRRGAHHQAALAAVVSALSRRGPATWSFSSISHALWLCFNVGCLLTLIALLSVRQYAFSWETTIFSETAYQRFTQTLALAPERLGFDTPAPETIAASQHAPVSEVDLETQRQWGHLLLGSVLAYGLLPRLLLLGACGLALAATRARYRLDLNQPGYLRLRSRLMEEETYLGVVADDSATGAPEVSGDSQQSAKRPPRPPGPPAVLGLEIEQPQFGWRPKDFFGLDIEDLGIVDDSPSRRRVLQRLRDDPTEPTPLVIVCDLTLTPDRGALSFLAAARQSLSEPAHIVLTGGERLRRRAETAEVGRRIQDWRDCLSSAGLEEMHIREIDLDHLTHETRLMLRSSIEKTAGEAVEVKRPSSAPDDPHIAAFDLIHEAALEWERKQQPPDWREQGRLHERIAGIYDSRNDAWRERWLPALSEKPSLDELRKIVRQRSASMLDLLPARLRHSPKWLVAGAATGALACITAGVFASPLAFAALPSWSIVGAAIGGAANLARGTSTSSDEPEHADHDFAQAVRSAVLFALLLHMQGQGEEQIAIVLDRAIPENDRPLSDSDEVRAYLDEIHRRCEDTAREGGRDG